MPCTCTCACCPHCFLGSPSMSISLSAASLYPPCCTFFSSISAVQAAAVQVCMCISSSVWLLYQPEAECQRPDTVAEAPGPCGSSKQGVRPVGLLSQVVPHCEQNTACALLLPTGFSLHTPASAVPLAVSSSPLPAVSELVSATCTPAEAACHTEMPNPLASLHHHIQHSCTWQMTATKNPVQCKLQLARHVDHLFCCSAVGYWAMLRDQHTNVGLAAQGVHLVPKVNVVVRHW